MKLVLTGPQAKRTGISGNASLKRGALLVTFQAALQHGSFFRLPLVPLFDLAELFLDLTKGRGVALPRSCNRCGPRTFLRDDLTC